MAVAVGRIFLAVLCAGAAQLQLAGGILDHSERPEKSGELVEQDLLPLRTLGRYIVDREHRRVKWACVNWAGAYSTTHVVGGLEVQPLRTLARRISQLGFNCVRLPYSTEGYIYNPVVAQADVAANPDLYGLRFQDIYDRVVQALTDEGLMVIINNHVSKSGWCCNVMQDEGYWYVPGYNESVWIESLIGLARRYRSNKLVVAFDLRNEPHDNPRGVVTWGDGNINTDWAMAAERAGNKVLAENPDALIVVSAICFCIDLRGLMRRQIHLELPNRVVYEVHNYIFSQYATLLMVNFGISWIHLEHFCATAAFICLLVCLVLHSAWKWLGEPLPPHGAFRMTVGFWLSFTFFVIALVFLFIERETDKTGGCNSYGVAYFLPSKDQFFVMASIALLFAGWGFHAFFTRGALQPRVAPVRAERGELRGLVDDRDSPSRDISTDSFDVRQQDDSPSSSPQVPLPLRNRATRVASGWESKDVAWDRVMGKDDGRIRPWNNKWDRGLCCGLQCFMIAIILATVFCLATVAAALGDSYLYLQWVFDWKWGFALQEGYPYTAPVWMGEFGGDTRGRYWKHLLSYMSVRDVDFAYWSLDGLKLTNGIYDKVGHWLPYATPRWEDETYGLLRADYKTIRHPWKLLDVQAIMTSPAGWTADDYPCDRAVLGNACGG